MIEMDVVSDDGRGWKPWWYNFCDYYEKQGVDIGDASEITKLLKKWNAVDLDQDSTKFYFKNEQDATMFLLRWS